MGLAFWGSSLDRIFIGSDSLFVCCASGSGSGQYAVRCLGAYSPFVEVTDSIVSHVDSCPSAHLR